MSKAVDAATTKAQQLVKQQHPEATTQSFVDDGMFFLTAEIGEGESRRTASHAYTLDSKEPAELQAAVEDLVERVNAELA